jgi:rubrerythrin
MQHETLQDLVQTLDIMSEVEKTVGEFYKECAGFFRFDSKFWLGLSRDEVLHSGALAKLSQMVKHKPSEYEPGKLSSSSALKTFISRIHSEQERLKNGTLTMYSALMAAYHMETTMIECSYTQVVKTTNTKCIEALENLSAANVEHRGKIKTKMERYRKDPRAPRAR